jgi:hypothetical protein
VVQWRQHDHHHQNRIRWGCGTQIGTDALLQQQCEPTECSVEHGGIRQHRSFFRVFWGRWIIASVQFKRGVIEDSVEIPVGVYKDLLGIIKYNEVLLTRVKPLARQDKDSNTLMDIAWSVKHMNRVLKELEGETP